ncbi:Hypothetical protein FKW44_008905 [Caligus rogercresseyi]|uniref:Uncharacterized protein n=1 Tax=Caligus rogercresseyi TaxID=217165 RepID=A0A7T8HEP0_CALRO|nr:Hypothetical protein FKW44_008905 [Caligus rogercresseyi]
MAKVIPFLWTGRRLRFSSSWLRRIREWRENQGRVNKSICCEQVDGIRGILRKEVEDGRDR